METTVIAYGMSHTSELVAFANTDRNTFRTAKIVYTFREHGNEWLARRIDTTVVMTKTDKYSDLTHVYKFDSRDEFEAWIKLNNPKGNYDVENGNAPFGYQHSPSAARARIETAMC